MIKFDNSLILFVPHWMTDILNREGLKYNTLFDLDKMKQLFSLEDLSIFYWLNVNNVLLDQPQAGVEYSLWKTTNDDSYVANNILPMRSIAQDNIKVRLFNEDDVDAQQHCIDDKVVQSPKFKLVSVIENSTITLVIQYPGGSSKDKHMLITELLKLLYAHAGYDSAASSVLFKGYIEKLALVNNVL